MSALVGRDLETGKEIRISDTARRSGLYVLGRPGMGKTSLLVNLIETDIQNGHGVFFLDPHGDAIDTLLTKLCSVGHRPDGTPIIAPASSVIFLDPTSERYSFGISLLACSDLASRAARRDTYNRAYNVFYKLWQQEWDQRPWLRLIIQHTLHAFIENQGYTLADVPTFLDPANTAFREHIVSNIKYNEEVADFWRNQFDAKREWDQQRQVDAALGRVRELLGDPDVRDIVGQTTTTLDFSDIIARGRILLLTLPPRLAYDSKRFIGTILINELLQAVYRRGDLPPDNRQQFCIFVDEFQHFCAWEAFTALFNEGRKYGIATTIAHQERYGQFADNKAIIGATDAAANKVMFALSVRDAEEIAPEFAKEPTHTDVRYEPHLVISQDPFTDLLQGHINPRIRAFVNNYLRPLKEALEDFPDRIGYTRALRQSTVDRAQIARLDERLDALLGRDSSYSVRYDALAGARELTLSAEEYTGDLLGLYQLSKGHRITIRQINKFLTALMEGTISPGQTAFGEFLIGCALEVCRERAPLEFYPALRCHIALTYGDTAAPLAIPTTFAQAHGLFPQAFATIHAEHAKLKDEHKAQHAAEFWHVRQQLYDETIEYAKTAKAQFGWKAEWTLSQLDHNLGVFDNTWHGQWHTEELLGYFLWLLAYPELQTMVSPYFNSRFACIVPPWSHIDTTQQILSRLMHDVGMLRRDANYTPPTARGLRGWLGQPSEDDDPPGFDPYAPHIRPHVLDAFEHFLNQHGEGALVVLALLQTAGDPTRWGPRHIPAPELYRFVVRDTDTAPGKPATDAVWERWAEGKSKIAPDPVMLTIPITGYQEYPGYSMVWLPPVSGHEPIDIALFVDKITDIMHGRDVQSDCRRFYQRLNGRDPYESIRKEYSIENILKAQTIKRLRYVADLLDKHQNVTPVFADPSRIWKVLERAADDILDDPTVGNMLLRLAKRATQGRDTTNSSLAFALVLRYLCCRVSDIVNFGTKVADTAFPQPSVVGMTTAEVTSQIDGIVLALRQPEIEEEGKREAEWRRKCEESINRSLAHISNSTIQMPPQLPAVIPTMEDVVNIKNACLAEFHQAVPNGQATLATIEAFAEFCTLLAKPENHIKMRGSQYVERPTGLRTVADMTNEMAQSLNRLDKFRAYAKIIEDAEGKMWNGSIWTPDPPTLPAWCRELEQASGVGGETHGSWNKQLQAAFAERTCLAAVTRDRLAVDKEITERRQYWKGTAGRNQPPTASQSAVKQLPPPPEPPPSFVSHQGPPPPPREADQTTPPPASQRTASPAASPFPPKGGPAPPPTSSDVIEGPALSRSAPPLSFSPLKASSRGGPAAQKTSVAPPTALHKSNPIPLTAATTGTPTMNTTNVNAEAINSIKTFLEPIVRDDIHRHEGAQPQYLYNPLDILATYAVFFE